MNKKSIISVIAIALLTTSTIQASQQQSELEKAKTLVEKATKHDDESLSKSAKQLKSIISDVESVDKSSDELKSSQKETTDQLATLREEIEKKKSANQLKETQISELQTRLQQLQNEKSAKEQQKEAERLKAEQEQEKAKQATQNASQPQPAQAQSASPVAANSSTKEYTLEEFMFTGRLNWGGYQYTYYSQQVLEGGALQIPGRHVNADGYVVDGDGYIVLANDAPKGTVFPTPFGAPGKVYDRGTTGNHLDVYIR